MRKTLYILLSLLLISFTCYAGYQVRSLIVDGTGTFGDDVTIAGALTATGTGTFDKLSFTNSTVTFDDVLIANSAFYNQGISSGNDLTYGVIAPIGESAYLYVAADGEGGTWKPAIYLGTDYTNARTYIWAESPAPIDMISSGDSSDYIRFQTASDIPEITTIGSADLKINAGGSNDLLLNHAGGNVGIGTTTPGGYKLNVNGTGYFADNISLATGKTVDGLDISTLGSTANGEGASLIGVEDADSIWTGTNVESVLNEIGDFVFTGSVLTVDLNIPATDSAKKIYKTVNEASTASSSGDLVMIMPGTYNEQVTLKVGVKYLGLDRATTIINATDDTLIFPSASAQRLWLEKLTITGNGGEQIMHLKSWPMFADCAIRSNGAGVGPPIIIISTTSGLNTFVDFIDSDINADITSTKTGNPVIKIILDGCVYNGTIDITGDTGGNDDLTIIDSSFDIGIIVIDSFSSRLTITGSLIFAETVDPIHLSGNGGTFDTVDIKNSIIDGDTGITIHDDVSTFTILGSRFNAVADDITIDVGATITGATIDKNTFSQGIAGAGTITYSGLNLFTGVGYVSEGDFGIGTGTPASLLDVDGAVGLAILTVTGNTTLDATHSTLLVNASGNVVITLPTAASAYNSTDGIGRIYEIKKIDADADTVTVDGNGAELIDGAATAVLTVQWESITLQSNGTAWYIL